MSPRVCAPGNAESRAGRIIGLDLPDSQPAVIIADLGVHDIVSATWRAEELIKDCPRIHSAVRAAGRIGGRRVVFDYYPRVGLSGANECLSWAAEVQLAGGGLGTPILIEETDRGRGPAVAVLLPGNADPGDWDRDGLPAGWTDWVRPMQSPVVGRWIPGRPWNVAALLTGDPSAAAIRDATGVTTYGDLSSMVADVAGRVLQEPGNGPVLLAGQRNARTVAAMLGCWAAGRSWCVADPDAAGPRYVNMVEHVRPETTIECNDIVVDREGRADLRPRTMRSDEVAYLVASSGSTGTSTIAALPCGGIAPLLEAWTDLYHLDIPQTVCQVGSLDGDVFLGDALKALMSGGCLVIVPDEDRANPERVAAILSEEACTFLESTPVMVRAVLTELDRNDRWWPRTVVVGSDAFRVEEAADLVALTDGRSRIINGFGTTETMIETITFECANLEPGDGPMCPLGEPLAGVEATIVDGEFNSVPQGDIGALVLRSPGNTLGEYRRGVLHMRPPGMWFATGDLASIDAQGRINHHGRHDSVVKVRGYRVHLGEVENALLNIHGVDEVYVTAFERAGTTELAGFVAGRDLTAEGIRQSAGGVLAVSATPAIINVMPHLPRLPTGKLDRMTMAASLERPDAKLGAVPIELGERVLYAWRAVLGEDVTEDETFFDQGGTSVLLLNLAARLREVLGEEPPFSTADLFRYPDIRSFTAVLRTRMAPDEGEADAVSAPDVPPSQTRSDDRMALLRQVAAGEVTAEEARRQMDRP